MNKSFKLLIALLTILNAVRADNPLVTHLYTADPTARVFGDRLYVFPSHDIDEHNGISGNNGFMMEDYHVFSTTDLINFTDHGVILDQKDVDWVDDNSYAMWAPDCIEYRGQYFFYFPGNFKVGVAVANKPEGPYVPHQKQIEYANGIDPCAFIDDDGTPYLYFGGGKGADSLKGMRLEKDMITPAMKPVPITLPEKYKEGSFVFKRGDIYYFTFPHDTTGVEDIAYATGKSPLGPFEYQGVIIKGSTEGCWTIHHSIVEYKGQWYLFYHHHDQTKDASLRSMAADKLYFNNDGTIREVIATRRGIGVRNAFDTIQVDRYTEHSGLSSPAFGRTEYGGFYVSNIRDGSWLKYPDVDFSKQRFPSVSARVFSPVYGGSIEVYESSTNGTLLATIPIAKTEKEWSVVTSKSLAQLSGTKDLVLLFRGEGAAENLFYVDWIRFNTPGTAQVYFQGNGYGTVTVDGSQRIESYETSALIKAPESLPVVLKAKALNGSRFEGWKLNGNAVKSISTINAGDRVEARFMADSPQRPIFENLDAEKFVQTGGVLAIDDVERGRGIGHIQDGDFVMFDNVDFNNGAVGVSVRAASASAGGRIQLFLDSMNGNPVCEISVNNTGGWKNWADFSASADLPGGVRTVYFKFRGEGIDLFHINHFKFKPIFMGLGTLEAEDFSEQSGIQSEPCKEGGRNIGYIENGDHIAFKNVEFNGSAAKVSARIASQGAGGKIEIRRGSLNSEPISTISVTTTGSWQSWETVNAPINIPAGTQDVYVTFRGGGGYLFNLNWIAFE